MPESATISAPSTPAPAITAPPTRAAVGSEPAVKPSDNAFAELEDLDAADAPVTTRRPDKREVKKLAEVKAQETKEPENKVEPAVSDKPPKPGERVLTDTEVGKMRTSELRPHYDAAKAKIKELEPQVYSLKKELEEARSKAPDVKPFEEKMSALEKENNSLKEEIQYVNFQKHPDFVTKYKQPYEEAWTKAVGEVTQLSLSTEDGQSRKATANDLLSLANAPLDQIDELADKWFGKAAPRVIRHVEKIRDLAESQDKVLEEAKKHAGEHEKQIGEHTKKQSEAIGMAYSSTQKELATKYPKYFSPDPEDKPGNELLEKGFAYADSVFSPNANQNLTPEQRVKRLAIIRAKSANHDRLVTRLKNASQRIADLESDLKEYEASSPTTDRGGQPLSGDKNYMDSAMDELDSLNK